MPTFTLVSGSAWGAAILIAWYSIMDGSDKSNKYILVTENFCVCYCVCIDGTFEHFSKTIQA